MKPTSVEMQEKDKYSQNIQQQLLKHYQWLTRESRD